MPQTVASTTGIHLLTVLEAGGSRSRCHQGWLSGEASSGLGVLELGAERKREGKRGQRCGGAESFLLSKQRVSSKEGSSAPLPAGPPVVGRQHLLDTHGLCC